MILQLIENDQFRQLIVLSTWQKHICYTPVFSKSMHSQKINILLQGLTPEWASL